MIRRFVQLLMVALVVVASIVVIQKPLTLHADTGTNWTGDYFSNPSLLGSPVFTRIDPALVFNWGPYSPGPGIGATYWSARWTSVQYMNAGTYQFTVTADDGVRVFIDGQDILDQWHDEGATTYTVNVQVAAGNHAFQVDYYQATGAASLSVSWNYLLQPSTAWTAEYFNNPNLAGTPVVVRYESAINWFWGNGSPDPAISPNNFSARWTATLAFSAATYRFSLAGDDGVRLYIDNALVINQWHQETLTGYSIDVPLAAGLHTLRVEYFQQTGNATVRFDYAIAVGPPPYPGTQSNQWYGEYYTNPYLQGSPAFIRLDGTSGINFNWSNNTPIPGFQHDSYSVRWTRQIFFPGQPYLFSLTVDDGARLYIDTTLIIDAWKVQAATTYTKVVDLTQGNHVIRLEYFQDHLGAVVNLTWSPPNGQNPPQAPYGSQLPPSSPTGVSGAVSIANVLNVRTGPGVIYDIVTRLLRGDTFSVYGRNADDSWVHVKTNNAIDGWLNTYYVAISGNLDALPIEAGPTAPPLVPNGVRGELFSGLRVRSGPAPSFQQIGELEWGSVVDVLGRSPDGLYYYIQYSGLTGWIYAPYVSIVSGNISDVPVVGG